MMSFRRESELRGVVSRYLADHSFSLQHEEVQFYDYSIDRYAYSSSRDETIAVELKLRKWGRALEQAIIYQLCADIVIVAMPNAGAERADVAEFDRYGVGLIGFSPSGAYKEYVTPRRSPVVRSHYRHAFIEELTGASLCPQ